MQLIPATSIFQGTGTEYRNTIFNRQKYVYKEGINAGSEFKVEYQEPLIATAIISELETTVNRKFTGITNVIEVRAYQPTRLTNNVIMTQVNSAVPSAIRNRVIPAKIESTVTSVIQTTNPYI